jgi:hypothetical protein
MGYKLCINFDPKSGLGYILGHFFTNPSGHLAADQLLFLERRRKSLMKRVMRALVANKGRFFSSVNAKRIKIWMSLLFTPNRVAKFFLKQYTKMGEKSKWPLNYQIAMKCTKWP